MEKLFKGIDVSKWQGEIDWTEVRQAGIQFAMIRCGYGKTPGQQDEYFEKNYSGAKANSIPVGVYHYSYAKSADDAKKEAAYCLSLIKGKTFEFPVAFDIEDNVQKDLSKAEITAIIRAFCEAVEAAGYYVAVYASLWWYNNKIDASVPERYDAWLAQWAEAPTFNGNFGMWQYTSGGTVSGISGRVDMDYAYKNYPNIMRVNGLNGFKKESSSSETKPDHQAFSPRQAVALYNTPLYISATAKQPSARKSGTFYIYDGIEINGRYRITSSPERAGKTPVGDNVTGYVLKSDLK